MWPIFMYMRKYVHAKVCIYICKCMSERMYVYVSLYVCTCMPLCMYISVWACM